MAACLRSSWRILFTPIDRIRGWVALLPNMTYRVSCLDPSAFWSALSRRPFRTGFQTPTHAEFSWLLADLELGSFPVGLLDADVRFVCLSLSLVLFTVLLPHCLHPSRVFDIMSRPDMRMAVSGSSPLCVIYRSRSTVKRWCNLTACISLASLLLGPNKSSVWLAQSCQRTQWVVHLRKLSLLDTRPVQHRELDRVHWTHLTWAYLQFYVLEPSFQQNHI
ncbi:hypothetical protein B0H66DRAFT_301124 [Apodospora peruviana]|uniref:Uncharacterized protein n=1 Tax=Apodospora peruviana TaxID=516989 RepID=A0AAE0M2S6_9PEZI|nr:hypothetical protein B0H66DRAFT_301124 [Apodospora peruviana]